MRLHETHVARELERHHNILVEEEMEPHWVQFTADAVGSAHSDPVSRTVCVMAMSSSDATAKARMVADRMSLTNLKITNIYTRTNKPEREVPQTRGINPAVNPSGLKQMGEKSKSKSVKKTRFVDAKEERVARRKRAGFVY